MNSGYIYIIGSMEHLNYVKIGISRNPPHISRLAELQIGNPFLLQIWASFCVPKIHILKYEKFIHKKMNEKKHFNEWFNISPKEALSIVPRLISDFEKMKKA